MFTPKRWLLAGPIVLIVAVTAWAGVSSAHLGGSRSKSLDAADVEIVITDDKIQNGNDGWVRFANGTKQWVSPRCRSRLVRAGAELSVVSWPTIRDLPDGPGRRCRDVLRPPVVVSGIEIVITDDKIRTGNDGWVRFANGTKTWVSPSCRTRLMAEGATITVLDWPTIRDLPDVSSSICDGSEPDTPDPDPDDEPDPDPEPDPDGDPDNPEPDPDTDPDHPDPDPDDEPDPDPEPDPDDEPDPDPEPDPDGDPDPEPDPDVLGPAANLELIRGNATRNTQFDDNPFRDVPADQLKVSDLTVNRDIYNEGLLDTTNSGYFRVKCEVSHFAYDDPIVHPNKPGRAHLHMFFGNTETNAYSTFDSLLNTGTGTCNGEDLNRSAYWVPALLDRQGNALIPDQIMVYYKNDNFRLNGANELVEPFPDNLRMIAGNAAATSPQTDVTGTWGSQTAISFTCGPAYHADHARQPLIPDCQGNQNSLEMQVAFPQCVNEADGTYQPDQSHISYSEGGYYGSRCPDSHPTDISSIMYRIFYRPADYGGSLTNLHLSSDVKHHGILPGGTTAHADWFGAWHPETMDMWIENCNNTQADCETGLLGRDPAISLVLRKQGHYPRGSVAPAEELIKLCPGKTIDPSNRLQSVAGCRMG